jgi:hypothetical protein
VISDYNLYCLQNIVCGIKQIMINVGYIACLGKGTVHDFHSRNLTGTRNDMIWKSWHRRVDNIKTDLQQKQNGGHGVN